MTADDAAERIDAIIDRVQHIATSPQMVAGVGRVMNLLWDAVAKYPPETAANRPGRVNAQGRPLGYYERGRGWWYPIVRRATLGTQLGKGRGAILAPKAVRAQGQVVGYKLRPTSEALGRKWHTEVVTTSDGVQGKLNNAVSYGPYVQGTQETQAERMKAIGWQGIDVVVQEQMPQIREEIVAAARQALEAL